MPFHIGPLPKPKLRPLPQPPKGKPAPKHPLPPHHKAAPVAPIHGAPKPR